MTKPDSLLAFECPIHPGILLLDCAQDNYCPDCGMRLRGDFRLGEPRTLHAKTLEMIQDAAVGARVRDGMDVIFTAMRVDGQGMTIGQQSMLRKMLLDGESA